MKKFINYIKELFDSNNIILVLSKAHAFYNFIIEFSEAVKLTNIFLKEGDNNTLKIRFDPKGVIRVASLADEQGSHESELAAEIEGEMLEVAFSAKYLLDFLNNVKCPILVFETSGNKSACLLRPQNQVEHEGFLHIIMPIQI